MTLNLAQQIKNSVSCLQLVDRYQLRRCKSGNYHSPHRDDKSASLSIFEDGKAFKDFTTNQRGSVIDFLMYLEPSINDVGVACKTLNDWFKVVTFEPTQVKREKTKIEWLADQCLKSPGLSKDYLVEKRMIIDAVVSRGIRAKTIGYNDYTNPKFKAGEKGYGGPCVAFITYDSVKQVNSINFRYIDKDLNGGMKTRSLGGKTGHYWCLEPRRFSKAKTVYITESAINALSIESTFSEKDRSIAIAMDGLNTDLDWSIFKGKRVIIVTDNDKPIEQGDMTGHRPGPVRSWSIYTALCRHLVVCDIIDFEEWTYNDCNDVLSLEDDPQKQLKPLLRKIDRALIPGRPAKISDGDQWIKQRYYLPPTDCEVYWRFRTKNDLTFYLKTERDQDGNAYDTFKDLCGFRICHIERVLLQHDLSTINGDGGGSEYGYIAYVRNPSNAYKLKKIHIAEDGLFELESWKAAGPIANPAQFKRMMLILQRITQHEKQRAVKFVGLGYIDKKMEVITPDRAFFNEGIRDCIYHDFMPYSGHRSQAKEIIHAFAITFENRAGLMLLNWVLCAHLKVFLGFYPHCVMTAHKGSGKGVILSKLNQATGIKLLGPSTLDTAWRLLSAVIGSSYPVAFDEVSTVSNKKQHLFNTTLQNTYGYMSMNYGSELTPKFQSASSLIVGEDFSNDSIISKTMFVELGKQGPMISDHLPRFPLLEFMEYMSQINKSSLMSNLEDIAHYLSSEIKSKINDSTIKRLINNYSGQILGWRMLADFARIPFDYLDFENYLVYACKQHISNCSHQLQPWVKIMSTIAGEIDIGAYKYPYKIEISDDAEHVIYIKSTNIIQHLRRTRELESVYEEIPIKTASVLRSQLAMANIIIDENKEKTIQGRRFSRMEVLSLKQLKQYGIYLSIPNEAEVNTLYP